MNICLIAVICYCFVVVFSAELSESLERDLFGRLEANEKLVQQLLGRVNQLEDQLSSEQQRTSDLEETVLQLLVVISTSNVAASADDNSEETTVTDANDDSARDLNQAKQRIRKAETDAPIAFFATLNNFITHAGVDQILVFDRVVTNLGNTYNNHNGNFIAPVSGTYVFSVTILSHYHNSGHFQLAKNGQLVSKLYVSGDEAGYDTTSQTSILQLQKGDDLCVHNLDSDVSLHGDNYCSFSGFLLQQDYSAGEVVVGKK